MATIVDLHEAQLLPDGQLKDWAYNALDVTGTREVADTLLPHLTPELAKVYAFERALQNPAMSMMLKGVKVDIIKRDSMIRELKQEMKKDVKALAQAPEIKQGWDGTEIVSGKCPADFGKNHKWPRGIPDSPEKHCLKCDQPRVVPKPYNPMSDDQTNHLFYDLLSVEKMQNKKGNVSTDGDVLDRISRKYPALEPLITRILDIRDKDKQLSTLNGRLSPDGRYMSSFNVGAAWTGRFSSSKSPFQLGGNLQNISEQHRVIFISDYKKDMGYADYKQGESNIVAHLSGDEKYLEAHRLGDVHTYVTRYIWPNLPWTGDLVKDKKIAKQNPPWDLAPGHDYRFQCKRIQHGSNYGLTPFGISMIAKIPLSEAKIAYERYMSEFNGIPTWQSWVRNEVELHHPLTNPMGRQITLFGRPWDKHTVRQGIAFLPQSTLADMDDLAMLMIWLELEEHGLDLLAQVHDALLHQFPEGELALEHRTMDLMSMAVPVTDINGITRIMRIGVESAVGKNWGHASDANPKGLREIDYDTLAH